MSTNRDITRVQQLQMRWKLCRNFLDLKRNNFYFIHFSKNNPHYGQNRAWKWYNILVFKTFFPSSMQLTYVHFAHVSLPNYPSKGHEMFTVSRSINFEQVSRITYLQNNLLSSSNKSWNRITPVLTSSTKNDITQVL